jgi:UDP-GlcNAc:undecaprenyl-phosphate/decaprenyl-phosphate GlcNAc-1-phosphate transferase
MAGIVAFALSLVLTPLVIVVLRRLDVLDHPNERSSHDLPVLRGGGLAFAAACLIGAVASVDALTRPGLGALVGAGVGGVIGLAEDIRGVPTLPRFVLQLAGSAAASFWLLSGLDGNTLWQLAFAAGCVASLATYMNAFNFMDGINGISAIQSLVAGLAWAWLGDVRDIEVLVWGGLILAGTSLGFLPFNFPRARIFLGDVGSYFIGAWQAALVIVGLRAGLPPEAVAAPVALYLADTGVTLVKRVRAGDVWHQPHREHAYQQLIRQGWSHVRTTVMVGAAVGLCSALGAITLGSLVSRVVADVLLAGALLAYLALPSWNAKRITRSAQTS